MKKTYKAPKYKVVDLTGEEMIAQSQQTVFGVQSGASLNSDVSEGEQLVKGHSLWDDEW